MTTRPWEELGKDVSATGSLGEAMTEADAFFHVSVRQGYFQDQHFKFDEKQGEAKLKYHAAKCHYYIVRDDIHVVLGACKTKFKPLQNDEAFSFVQSFIEDGICTIDTIGTIGMGQKVWLLAKICGSKYQVVPGDDIEIFLILVNAHDGTTSVMVGIVPVRIFCSNMFSMLNRSDFQIVKFKHTGEVAEKLKAVQSAINEQLATVEGFVGRLRELAKTQISYTELDEYFRTVLSVKTEEDASTKANNKIKRLHELFIHGQGNQQEEVRGSWYAAYNAVSEYLNYEAGRSAETRLNSLWFGANNNINHKALTYAVYCVGEKDAVQ
jgi:phage/plasmid-like protein (TIGR03299 family)